MSAIHYSTRESHAVSSRWHFGRYALAVVVDVLLWLPRFWKARSELGDLAGMGMRECQDIGFTGCDIERFLTPPNPLRKRELL
jgi:hypothetical protein